MTADVPSSGSSPPAGAPGQSLPKDWLAKISAFSAVAAALLSAIVTLRVTNIQTDTKELLAVRQDSIQRAELFRNLIQDLNDDSKSGYALLTLWKLYEQPKDRKVVVLAALENPKPDTINTLTRMGFEKELEDYSDTLARIAKSGIGESADVAENIILQALSPISTARYLLDVLAGATIIDPHTLNVQNLITLSERHDDVMALVAEQEKRSDQERPLFAYIQYKAGKPAPFIDYLKNVRADPEEFRIFLELMTKLTPEDLARDDWPHIVETVADFLAQNSPGTHDFSESEAFALINRDSFGGADLSAEQQNKVVDLCIAYFRHANISDNTRSKALDCLLSWDSSKTRQTVAEYLSCEGNYNIDRDMFTSVSIDDALSNNLVFKPSVPPASSSEEWRRWFKSNYPEEELNCRR